MQIFREELFRLMNTIVIIAIIIWIASAFIKGSEEDKRVAAEKEKEIESYRVELKKLGATDEEIFEMDLYSVFDFQDQVKKLKRRNENKQINQQKLRQQEEEAQKLKEADRIAQAYAKRPTVLEMSDMSKDSFNEVSPDDADYLDVSIYGYSLQYRFFYVAEDEYENCRSWINKFDEILEYINGTADLEDWDLDEAFDSIYDSSYHVFENLLTEYIEIYSVELGTKSLFNNFDVKENVKDDPTSFGKLIKSHLGLETINSGIIFIEREIARKHLIHGAIGLSSDLKSKLSKENISFYRTHFVLEDKKYGYSESFLDYDDFDTWNDITKHIIHVSELDSITYSDYL